MNPLKILAMKCEVMQTLAFLSIDVNTVMYFHNP